MSLTYTNLTQAVIEQCAQLERLVFPSTDAEDLLSVADIHAYADIFPQGFFVCLDGDRVVGQGAGIFLDFDFDSPQHSLLEVTGANHCGNHNPAGSWYYGTDIAVHADYRRRGIGRFFYELRKDLVISENRRGIVAGGYLPGFAKYKARMSAQQYVDGVVAGDLYDPTLTFQLGNGFEVPRCVE